MFRKITLNRKGFDGEAGVKPSFIYETCLFLLPIPADSSVITYQDLMFNQQTPLDTIMNDAGIQGYTDCHLDPPSS